MNKQPNNPKIVRYILYMVTSLQFIKLFDDWPAIGLGMLGIINFKKGYLLHLRNGLKFEALHFMDAWTLSEVFNEKIYNFKPKKSTYTVIDIGANIGDFSIFAASKSKNVKVYSFEPIKTTYRQLLNNIGLNSLEKQIIPFNLAVGGSKKRLKLFVSKLSGLASIYKTRGEKEYKTVDCTTLADIFSTNKISRCHYLKIDCEGAEYQIIKKCPEKTLKKIDFMAIEYHDIVPGESPDSLAKYLRKSGFKVKKQYNKIERDIGYIYATR